jgi:hypothetical protein
MTKTYDMPLDTPPRSNPFQALNKVAAWWQLRPTDNGDGKGYTGIALHVKRYHDTHIEDREFLGTDLDALIAEGTTWASEFTKAEQQTSKTKRVIPRS